MNNRPTTNAGQRLSCARMPAAVSPSASHSVHWRLKCFAVLLTLIGLGGLPTRGLAHEMWVLRPDQVLFWNAQPKPSLFTELQPISLFIFGAALLINITLLSLHERGADEFFPALRRTLVRLSPYTPFVLRLCCAWALFSASFAFEPRYGNMIMAEPTLLAPDLLVASLPEHWQWLRWLQVGIAVMLILGAYVRLASVLLLGLLSASLLLLGKPVLAYFLSYLGVAIYLLCRGGGMALLTLPEPALFSGLRQRLAQVPAQRCQFILRVLAGLNFLYLAVLFKVLQPNLAMAIIVEHQLPIMGMNPEVVVLIMAITEVSLGFLMLFGIVPRLLAIILFVAFFFFALNLSHAETITSHILYYGVAISFLFSGRGYWAGTRERDFSSANTASATPENGAIILIGEGNAAITALQKLRQLYADDPNTRLCLIHRHSVFVEPTLLADYVAGRISSASVQCPVDKLLCQGECLEGELSHIDQAKRTVQITHTNGQQQTLPYRQLIDLNGPNHQPAHGLKLSDAWPCSTLIDAMALKQRLRLGLTQPPGSQALACVVGAGELADHLAIAIRALARQLDPDQGASVPIYRLETTSLALSSRQQNAREKTLSRHGITSLSTHQIRAIDQQGIHPRQGKRLAVHTVIDLGAGNQAAGVSPKADSHCLRPVWTPGAFNQLAQSDSVAKQLALNAWARDQALSNKRLRYHAPYRHDYYLGADSSISLLGVYLPRPLAAVVARWRVLCAVPCLEQAIRLGFDGVASTLFGPDTGAGIASKAATAKPKINQNRRAHHSALPLRRAA